MGDKTLQSLGISNDHVLHLNMSSRESPTVEATSCLRQLFVPSHSGVEASLGRYAESSWTDEERAKSIEDIKAQTEDITTVAKDEFPPLWYRLFVPSHSGVATLGSYADPVMLQNGITTDTIG